MSEGKEESRVRIKVIPREITCKSALNKTGIPGFEYCLNPYGGCTHACVYCYASFMCRFTGHQEKWGQFLDAKINFPEVLAKQLSRRTKPQGKVLVGTVTDAYQPVESHYKITRTSLEILADYQLLEVHVLTKSALVERDLSILQRMRACKVGFSIITMDRTIARVLEPGASSPLLRLAAAHKLQAAGIPVWVFIAPLLPGISDTEEALTSLMQNLHQAGITDLSIDYLNPYPQVVQRLKSIYRRYFPQALVELEEYLRHPVIYLANIEPRLHQVSALFGNQPRFV